MCPSHILDLDKKEKSERAEKMLRQVFSRSGRRFIYNSNVVRNVSITSGNMDEVKQEFPKDTPVRLTANGGKWSDDVFFLSLQIFFEMKACSPIPHMRYIMLSILQKRIFECFAI